MKRTGIQHLLNIYTLCFCRAGVVCAFLSNELVYQKLRNEGNVGPVGKFTAMLDHVDGFANTTVNVSRQIDFWNFELETFK